MKNLIRICLVVLFVTSSVIANVSYDFGSMGFSEGQNVEGLALTSAVITSETSNMWYTDSYGGGLLAHFGGAADLYINFSAPINQISATGGNGAGDSDAFSLYLYEFGTDNFLGRYDTPVFGGAAEPQWYTLSVSVSNVGRVVFDPGNSGVLPGTIGGLGGVVMTNLSYNCGVIPAPGAILLGSVGIGLVGWLRRRRTI